MTGADANDVRPLAKALAEAQSELRNVERSKAGQVRGRRDYRYAGLDDLLDAIRPVLSRHGIAFTQILLTGEHGLILQTVLLHADGGQIASDYPIPRLDNPQEQGSAITYARRYSLEAICGVAPTYDPTDDDGSSAAAAIEDARSAAPPDERSQVLSELRAVATELGAGRLAPLRAVTGVGPESSLSELRSLLARYTRIRAHRATADRWVDPEAPHGVALEDAIGAAEEATSLVDAVEAAIATGAPMVGSDPAPDVNENPKEARRYLEYLRGLATL